MLREQLVAHLSERFVFAHGKGEPPSYVDDIAKPSAGCVQQLLHMTKEVSRLRLDAPCPRGNTRALPNDGACEHPRSVTHYSRRVMQTDRRVFALSDLSSREMRCRGGDRIERERSTVGLSRWELYDGDRWPVLAREQLLECIFDLCPSAKICQEHAQAQ
jgi:hypothetical protein